MEKIIIIISLLLSISCNSKVFVDDCFKYCPWTECDNPFEKIYYGKIVEKKAGYAKYKMCEDKDLTDCYESSKKENTFYGRSFFRIKCN